MGGGWSGKRLRREMSRRREMTRGMSRKQDNVIVELVEASCGFVVKGDVAEGDVALGVSDDEAHAKEAVEEVEASEEDVVEGTPEEVMLAGVVEGDAVVGSGMFWRPFTAKRTYWGRTDSGMVKGC